MRNNKIGEIMACRVCGLYQADAPWGRDGTAPSYNICPCCGSEFGYDDATRAAVLRKRVLWRAAGSVWFAPAEKPSNWSLSAQMEQIPSDYVDDQA